MSNVETTVTHIGAQPPQAPPPATPPISLDRVMKSVWLLEQMGRASLGLRKAAN
jgi:hypothetical protein